MGNNDTPPPQASLATPRADLERYITDSNVPKNEAEWWAHHEIERLRSLLASEEEATARIARVEAAHEETAALLHAYMQLHSEATARAERAEGLWAAFAKHETWELSHGSFEDEEDEPRWCVHDRHGNVNDTEWRLIGRGDTPAEAIRAAQEPSDGE